jgi:hypothetical protein
MSERGAGLTRSKMTRFGSRAAYFAVMHNAVFGGRL